MPTRRLYYDDSFLAEFTARVLRCEPVSFSSAEGVVAPAWGVLLDQTAFYPASGGQPNDLGKLGQASVLDVCDDGDEVLHIVDAELREGPVSARLDWPRRFDHMQQHSGQHLLSAIFLERFGLPTVSFHLGTDSSSIDLRGPQPSDDVLESAERAANTVIFEDRPVSIRYGTRAELAALGVRKEVEREGTLRAIEIAGADLQPCGGTHVSRTGQIGGLLVRRCYKMRQDWRVEFVCGERARRVARRDFALLQQAAQKLSCAAEELPLAAARVLEERDANHKTARSVMQKLAVAEAALALQATPPDGNGLRIVERVIEGLPPAFLAAFSMELAKTPNTIGLLARSECGHVFFSQHPTAARDMGDLLQRVLAQVGGKGGGSKDAARGSLSDRRNARQALDSALRLLRG